MRRPSMSVRRLWLAAALGPVLAGCLDPGDPVLARRDTDPPEVVSTEPVSGATLAKDGALRITFSESMDMRSLPGGIAVLASGTDGGTEVPLTFTVPPVPELEEDVELGDVPYTVTATAAEGTFVPGTAHTLVLRTSLTDFEGNPLADEVRVPFRTGP